MNIELIVILCTILGVFTTIIVNSWITIKAIQAGTHKVTEDLRILNESLGQMYSQIIESGVGIEAPNPVVSVFAEMLKNQIQNKSNPKILSRNPDGTFSDNS